MTHWTRLKSRQIGQLPTPVLPRERIPAWLKAIPSRFVLWDDADGVRRLEEHLSAQGLPRPTLFELASERHHRMEARRRIRLRDLDAA